MKHRLSYVRSFFPICLNTSDLQNEMILAEIMTFLFYCKIPFIFQDYDHMDPEPRFKEHSRGKQSKKGMCSMSCTASYNMCPCCSNYLCLCFPDDPYYCGLRARIPNFAKSKAQRDRESSRMASQQPPPQQQNSQPQQPPLNPGVHHPMAAWHHGARGY